MAELDTTQQAVLNSIISIMTGSSLTEQFYTDVLLRLGSLGYVIKEGDDWMISFGIQKVESNIKNECNVTLIPDGLYKTAVEMICGEFLFTKKQSGKLEGFNLDAALKSVQAGDTTVTFAVGSGSMTPEQRLDSLLSHLMSNGRGEFACYRKIKW